MTAPRHQGREAALQILYFCQIAAVVPDEALGTFFAEHHPDASDDVRAFANRLVAGRLLRLEIQEDPELEDWGCIAIKYRENDMTAEDLMVVHNAWTRDIIKYCPKMLTYRFYFSSEYQ